MEIVSQIGEKVFDFKIEPDKDNEHLFFFDSDNERTSVEIIELKRESVTVSINNRVRFFEIVREKGVIKEVTTAARIFPVEVKTPQQEQYERVLASYVGAQAKSIKKEIRSPMPGKILEINISPGERVELGQVVAILEAMKMENEITSTIDGIVKEIYVGKGEKVALDQVIIVFQ